MLDEKDRKQRQADAVAREVMQGARLESNADYQSVMVGGARINHLLHFLVGIFTCGLWWIVWLFHAFTGGERRYIVRTDEFGNTLVEKGAGLRKGIVAAVVGGMALLVVVLVAIVAVAGGGNGDSTAMPNATATPIVPIADVTITQLLDEREVNATRYDDTYRGKWVTVTGIVERIDNDTVYLESGFLSGGALRGLSREQQSELNAGQRMTFLCVVGDFLFGTIQMNDCR